MLTDGTPLAYSDLKVDGNDLVGTKLPEDKRAWAMRKFWNTPSCTKTVARGNRNFNI